MIHGDIEACPQGVHVRALCCLPSIDSLDEDPAHGLNPPGEQVPQETEVLLKLRVPFRNPKGQLPAVAPRYYHEIFAAIHQMGAGHSPRQLSFEDLQPDPAQGCRVGCTEPVDRFSRSLSLEHTERLVGNELGPRYSFEEISGQNLAGEFHQPEGAKDACPSEWGQLVLEEFPEKDPVALQQQPDSIFPLLLVFDQTFLTGRIGNLMPVSQEGNGVLPA